MDSAPTDANSCFARLIALELQGHGIVPWLDKLNLGNASRPLCSEVDEVLTKADAIIICLAPGDLSRCAEDSEDFFGFELQTSLRLGRNGKTIHVLMHDVSVEALLREETLEGMNRCFDGLGTKLKDWLVCYRRYHVDLAGPDDNWCKIMDSIGNLAIKTSRSKRVHKINRRI